MTAIDGIIVLIAFILGFACRDFDVGRASKMADTKQEQQAKQAPKVELMFPQNTPEQEKKKEAAQFKEVLKKANIEEIK
jgi:hypothetical protein